MKVWLGYGSEHSANLVIIGTFKSTEEAQDTKSLLDEMTRIAEQDEKSGHLKIDGGNTKFSKTFLEYCGEQNFMWFGPNDPTQFLYENRTRVEGDKLVITTEESEFSAFLKVMLHGGAKIEIYSAHDYPGSRGR